MLSGPLSATPSFSKIEFFVIARVNVDVHIIIHGFALSGCDEHSQFNSSASSSRNSFGSSRYGCAPVSLFVDFGGLTLARASGVRNF